MSHRCSFPVADSFLPEGVRKGARQEENTQDTLSIQGVNDVETKSSDITETRLPLDGADLDIRCRDEKVADEAANKQTGPDQDANEGVRLRIAKPVLFAFSPPHRRRLLNKSGDRYHIERVKEGWLTTST